MEIGNALVRPFQHLDGIVEETEQAFVRFRILYETEQYFGEEKRQHALHRIAAPFVRPQAETRLFNALHLPPVQMLYLQLQNRKRDEQRAHHTRFLSPSARNQIRNPPECLRIHIYNMVCLLVRNRAQDDSPRLIQHKNNLLFLLITLQRYDLSPDSKNLPPREKLPGKGRKTFFSNYVFCKYRRYFFIFRLKTHKYRRYLYKHRRYSKKTLREKELSIGMPKAFAGV